MVFDALLMLLVLRVICLILLSLPNTGSLSFITLNKFLSLKVLWVKKSIVWELEVCIKDENNEKILPNIGNIEE